MKSYTDRDNGIMILSIWIVPNMWFEGDNRVRVSIYGYDRANYPCDRDWIIETIGM